jgi:hypothetical protein
MNGIASGLWPNGRAETSARCDKPGGAALEVAFIGRGEEARVAAAGVAAVTPHRPL